MIIAALSQLFAQSFNTDPPCNTLLWFDVDEDYGLLLNALAEAGMPLRIVHSEGDLIRLRAELQYRQAGEKLIVYLPYRRDDPVVDILTPLLPLTATFNDSLLRFLSQHDVEFPEDPKTRNAIKDVLPRLALQSLGKGPGYWKKVLASLDAVREELLGDFEETLLRFLALPQETLGELRQRQVESFFLALLGSRYGLEASDHQAAAEHVARLMSFCLLQAMRADPDGILPLSAASGHVPALELLRRGLEEHFGEAGAYQVELDAAGYLGRPLGEWLEHTFWKEYHVKWYKRRPILWQVGSARGTFSAFLYIHKLSRDTLPRLRTLYLWPARNAVQAALENAHLREQGGERGAGKEVARLETALEDLQDFETRLLSVIEGRVKCAIPEWAQGPFRNGMYDPVLDDGVAVNLAPLQEAGVVRGKVV